MLQLMTIPMMFSFWASTDVIKLNHTNSLLSTLQHFHLFLNRSDDAPVAVNLLQQHATVDKHAT